MSDIVERLQETAECADYGADRQVAQDARDWITRLRAEVERLTKTSKAAKENRDSLLKAMIAKDAEIERLRATLRPFAEYGKHGDFQMLDVETPVSLVVEPHIVWLEDALKIVDFQEARAALAGAEKEGE